MDCTYLTEPRSKSTFRAQEAIAGYIRDLTYNGEPIPIEEPRFAVVTIETDIEDRVPERATA